MKQQSQFPRILLALVLAGTCFLFEKPSLAQTYIPSYRWQVDSLIVIDRSDFVFAFPETHRPLLQSLRIYKNSVLLREEMDYRVYEESLIRFFPPPSDSDTLIINYKRQPLDLKKKYYLFEKDTLRQQAPGDSLIAQKETVRLREIKFENPFTDFTPGLNKSGSIMRGVKIGTNQDLTLNSGLNLELSGQLTDNVEIVAALTDESTPIQPEGNTQTLDEVDKVFVEFRSPHIGGTVGDLNLTYENTQFANLSRKLQGITLNGTYDSHIAGATIATTRGYFNRNSLIGREGNQGPYQLTGKNGEREIIVLAGTERVWVDGQKMTRGESNDYVIEYGNGQITFTNRRMITGDSRIEVDFEYFPATQDYSRNVYSGMIGGAAAEGKLNYRFQYYREFDDKDRVLEEGGTLTEEEKEILRQSGDDPLEAYTTGVTQVADSAGSYIKVDTLINNESYSYYKYVGSKAGNFSVIFSLVGSKKGDYSRDRLGVYRWVGIGNGEYLPRRFLPLPASHNLADAKINWKPGKHFSMNAEYALSQLDKNTFSSLDDNNNTGNALNVKSELNEIPVNIGSARLGVMDLSLDTRFIDDTFESVDRFNEPDYQRYWNLGTASGQSSEERSYQLNGNYRPMKTLKLTGNAGILDKTDFSSKRYMGRLNFEDKHLFTGNAKYEFVGSETGSGLTKDDWVRYEGDIKKDIWKIQPNLLYNYEQRQTDKNGTLTGFEFDDYGIRFGLIEMRYVSGYVQYNMREDAVYDIEDRGKLLPQSTTATRRFRIDLQNYEETSASLEIVQRDKDYKPFFENIKVDTLKLQYADASVQDTTWQDRETNLIDFNLTHSRWKKAVNFSMQYKISTEQTALKEKIYLDVGEGDGNLRYDEALDEYVPDPDGNYNLYIVPSDKFEPVTNLQTAFRVTYDPSKFWRRSTGNLIKILSNVSGESYFRVEEETRESDLTSIYTLNLSDFQGDQTIRGSIIYNQDLYLMRRNRDLSFRLRYRYRDDRSNQYLDPGENEDQLLIERGIRADWRIISDLKSQTEFSQKLTTRESRSNTFRNRDIFGWYVNQKFSYRPTDRWEFGIEPEYGREHNYVSTYPLVLWFGVLRNRINYSIPAKGRISAEYEYQTVNTLDNPLNLSVPYEMANGKKEGISKKWQLRAEYTVAKNIVFTLFYNGRDDASAKNIIHTGQAEIRAFF